MKTEYPFKFSYIPVSDEMLDKLGFSEYYSMSSSICGYRQLDFDECEHSLRIIVHDETSDPDEGYGSGTPIYMSWHISKYFFRNDSGMVECDWDWIHFFHELYEYVAMVSPEFLSLFEKRCRERGVNMGY